MNEELKMKCVIILLCFCIWCVESNLSNLLLNKLALETRDVNMSEYAYETKQEAPSKAGTTLMQKEVPPRVSNPTTAPSVCNASYEEDVPPQRRKRFIFYFLDHPTTTEAADVDLSHLSDEFQNCSHITVEPGCYKILPDASVYVPAYKRAFSRGNYLIRERLLFVCSNFFDDFVEEKYSKNIETISIVGVSISSVCIILHMFMFCAIKKLRNLPGYCLFSLCISLLMTYITFFTPIMVSKQTDCKVIATLIIYCLLSSFFWMNVTSFDVWYAIRLATAKLRLSTNKSMWKRFSLYSAYAWGMPLLIIAMIFIGDQVIQDERFRPTFNDDTCWFQNKNALLIYFALPVFIVLVMNIIYFVASFVMITRSWADSGCEEAHNLRSRLFMSLRLGSAMGLMWIFGLLSNLTHSEWIDYLNALCTTLQGVFIFFSFTLNKKTQKACKKVLKSKKISMLSILSQRRKTSALSMTESISSDEK